MLGSICQVVGGGGRVGWGGVGLGGVGWGSAVHAG